MGCMKNIVLVCEDVAHRNFITFALKELGVENLNHRLDAWVASTELIGGNLTSVISRVKEVEFDSWQAECKKHKVLLIVVADADAASHEERREDFPLSSECAELFVVVIPKRNIETWVKMGLANSRTTVDAETDYKTNETLNPKNVKKAVKHLVSIVDSANAIEEAIVSADVWDAFLAAMHGIRKGLRALTADN